MGVSGSGGGPGSWGPGGWGPGGFGGPGGHGGRGRRSGSVPDDDGLAQGPPADTLERLRDGTTGGQRDVLAAILLLLDEWAMRESQLSEEIAERSGSAWRVSASYVTEALASLQLAGIVGRSDVHGHDVAHLTRRGSEYVERNRDDLGCPWDDVETTVDTARWTTGDSSGAGRSRRAPGPSRGGPPSSG